MLRLASRAVECKHGGRTVRQRRVNVAYLVTSNGLGEDVSFCFSAYVSHCDGPVLLVMHEVLRDRIASTERL